MIKITYGTLVVCVLATSISGCRTDAEDPAEQVLPAVSTTITTDNGADDTQTTQWTETTELAAGIDAQEQGDALSTPLSSDNIPYPLYPNGSRYRIGDQGDLKIVLFQTTDSFEEVDAFYQKEANMPRLSAMSDYVRYSVDEDDIDPWETSRPGIVIHQFNDASERDAVGADDQARTNIIMSFQ